MKSIVFGLSLIVVALLILTDSDFPIWMRIGAGLGIGMKVSIEIYNFFHREDSDEEASNRSL